MQLDLSELLREVGAEETYTVDHPPLEADGVECESPITGSLTFTNAGGTLHIRGTVSTAEHLDCSRCGQDFRRPVGLRIVEEFELRRQIGVSRAVQTVAVVEDDESPAAGKLFDGSLFDLTELLRQELVLDLPTQPLPELDCSGRCSQCGRTPEDVLAELNANAGDEQPANPLSRLAELLGDHDAADGQ